MKKKLTAVLAAGLLASTAYAQNELSNFTATGRGGVTQTFTNDYQSIGINPANLGRKDAPRVAFSIAEVGVGVGSQAITREQLNKFIRNSSDPISQAEKVDFANAFNNDNVLNLNAHVSIFALSFQIPKIGGFGVSYRSRTAGHIGLNKNASEILFLGKDAPIYQEFAPSDTSIRVSEAFDGTEIKASMLNEWNISYGVNLLNLPALELNAGVGYKYIQGIGVVDVQVRDGEAKAYSSVSPLFSIDYDQYLNNPDFNAELRENGFQPVGHGHGLDLAVSGKLANMVRFGVAVTDIGSITWKGNLLEANDQPLVRLESDGINSYEFFDEVVDMMATGNGSLFSYSPAEERTESLPTKLRAGAGFTLTENIEAGLDVAVPLNKVAGNLPNTFVGLGLDVKPVNFLKVSTGLSAGAGYSLSLPLGLTVVTPNYEFGIATRDVASLYSENNPYMSAALGFLRFKIGGGANN